MHCPLKEREAGRESMTTTVGRQRLQPLVLLLSARPDLQDKSYEGPTMQRQAQLNKLHSF